MVAVAITEASRSLGVDTTTLRRWIREGCPTESPGGVGRGHGALVDPEAVRRWRAHRSGIADVDLAPVMQRVAAGLLEMLMRDGGEGVPVHRTIGISERQAAAMLALAFERIHRSVVGHDADSLPPEIERIRSICLRSPSL